MRLLTPLLILCCANALAQEALEEAVGPVAPSWWGNGSAHARWENAGGQDSGNFSALVPLHGTLGEAGTLSGSLLFAEPYGQWWEGGAYQAGLGAGFRHLFGKQSVSALYERPAGLPGFLEEGIYVGANAFLNGLNTAGDQSFWQAAFTAEVGTRWLELRGRYHLPLDDGEQSTERFVNRYSRSFNFDGVRGTETFVTDTTLTLLTESLRGWQADATLLVPGIDRWADLRVIGGYASFESPTLDSLEYGSWRLGVDFRPVPAVVLSAMWHENERLFGDHWLFSVGVEVPFETRNLGDGNGGFWGHVKRAFQPRRRHLAERMIEPARRHSLPMQLATSVQKVEASYQYNVSVILPDGRVVTFEDRGRVRGVGSNSGGTSASGGLQLEGGSTPSSASNMTFMTGTFGSSVQIATVVIDYSQFQSLMAFQGLQIYTGSAPMNDLLTSMLGGSVLILLGPAGQQVYGTQDYLASEAGQAAMAALIAQGYTVPVVP
jgi:hypothetical protein